MAETGNIQRVRDFIAAWEARDATRILSFFAEDAVYHNIPMDPLKGLAQIRGMIEPFVAAAKEVKWTTHFAAETDSGAVLTERTDTFVLANGQSVSVPVMGTFEFKNGKITGWRDYFDLADFQKQMA